MSSDWFVRGLYWLRGVTSLPALYDFMSILSVTVTLELEFFFVIGFVASRRLFYYESCDQNAKCANESNNSVKWCLDSGVTSHICTELSEFANTVNGNHDRLNLANGAFTQIAMKGTVSLQRVWWDKKRLSEKYSTQSRSPYEFHVGSMDYK